MTPLRIEEGKNTPSVIADAINGTLSFNGNSFPENVRTFYDPIIDWMDEFRSDTDHIIINCRFYYMASSSVIVFLKVLKKIASSFDKSKIQINWFYEEGDDDIKKIGQDYSHLLSIPFNFYEEEEA